MILRPNSKTERSLLPWQEKVRCRALESNQIIPFTASLLSHSSDDTCWKTEKKNICEQAIASPT